MTMFCKKIFAKSTKTIPPAIKFTVNIFDPNAPNAKRAMKNTEGNICLINLFQFNDLIVIR